MRKINFTKMVATGNDFVVIENGHHLTMSVSLKSLAKKICDRKYGIGADGLLVLEKSHLADIKMRVFNPNGSEVNMCGNGSRCVAAYWVSRKHKAQNTKLDIETKAGIIACRVNGNKVKIKLTEPKNLKLNMPIRMNKRILRVNFINTGVPHAVIFVEGLDKIDVPGIGRRIRYHKQFQPLGTNVDFVEIINSHSIKIRTYERGVEDETLACGTGAVASCLIAYRLSLIAKTFADVLTRSDEMLRVYFKREKNSFSDIWLEGKTAIVYKGVYYV